MSELEKQLVKEITGEAKTLTKDGLIYVRGAIDGLKAQQKKEEKE